MTETTGYFEVKYKDGRQDGWLVSKEQAENALNRMEQFNPPDCPSRMCRIGAHAVVDMADVTSMCFEARK